LLYALTIGNDQPKNGI